MTLQKTKKNYDHYALILQGGGSLGAYHIGVYEALNKAAIKLDTIAGISIGAFTAAIIAGNEPENRLERLHAFWESISWPDFPKTPGIDQMRTLHHKITSLQGVLFGQPNFFVPRFPGPQLHPRGSIAATSYYDTSRLKSTLKKYIDFDRINAKEMRLILGATRVKDGEHVFFDNANMRITPEHVMASGAMPPGFPGVRLEGDLYWDGGCVANTPLEQLFRSKKDENTLVFMVDLFTPFGDEPQDMEDVTIRSKDILYTSRTSHHIDHVIDRHNLSVALQEALNSMPETQKKIELQKSLRKIGNEYGHFDIVHIIYDSTKHKISSRDCEFSKSSLKSRSKYGFEDTEKILTQAPWLKDRSINQAARVHKFIGGKVAS